MNSRLSLRYEIFRRYFSLSAVRRSSCPQPRFGPQESQRSGLMNGIKVGCLQPMGSQVSSCTIMFQAGSRYEVDGQLGASHFLRSSSSAAGCRYTSFMKARRLQQLGAYLTCSSDRQSVAYTLRCNPTHFPELSDYLVDTAGRCLYNQWDLDERKPQIKTDLEWITPEQRVLDLVQKACWAGPLSNSIFCEPERVGSMKSDDMMQFVQRNFTTNRCTVATYGVPFDESMRIAECLPPRIECPGGVSPCPMPRGGVEFYDMGPCSDCWVAVAVPGTGSCDLCCLMKHAIIAEASGTGNMASGQQELNRVPMPLLGLAAKHYPYQDFKAFNISYLDTGVFGVLVKASPFGVHEAAQVAACYLADIGNLDFNQIERGKKRLQIAMASHLDSSVRVTEGMALMLVNNHKLDTAPSAITMIEQITPDEVSVTAKILSTKRCEIAVGIVGDVGRIPNDKDILATIK